MWLANVKGRFCEEERRSHNICVTVTVTKSNSKRKVGVENRKSNTESKQRVQGE